MIDTYIISPDKFGSSLDYPEMSALGMLYESRLSLNYDILSVSMKTVDNDETTENISRNIQDTTVEIVDSDSDSDDIIDSSLNPKQQLAITVKNWSKIPENDESIISEGAIQALIGLSSVDETIVRRCCSEALYHLSTRGRNRQALLDLGTTAGIASMATSIKSWKVAKCCALTLYNLSMYQEGESRLAKEGSTHAVNILLSIRNNCPLLPVCVQTLYNMTCVSKEFQGLERVIRVLLNLPFCPYFDPTTVIMMSLVNATRFESIRPRAIEDGCFIIFATLMNNVSMRPNGKELAFYLATTLRSLSETKSCRTEMI